MDENACNGRGEKNLCSLDTRFAVWSVKGTNSTHMSLGLYVHCLALDLSIATVHIKRNKATLPNMCRFRVVCCLDLFLLYIYIYYYYYYYYCHYY